MMDSKGVRNMYSIPVVVNKHNTARVASCWFIIYYRLVMHGDSNIKLLNVLCFRNWPEDGSVNGHVAGFIVLITYICCVMTE